MTFVGTPSHLTNLDPQDLARPQPHKTDLKGACKAQNALQERKASHSFNGVAWQWQCAIDRHSA